MAALGEAPLLKHQTQERQVQAFHAQWFGSLALGSTVEPPAEIKTTPEDVNILTKIQEARTDPESRKWLEVNAITSIAEAVFHGGHISTVHWDRDTSGQMIQFGQPQDSVHRNAVLHRPSTKHPVLKDITQLEILNGQRIQHKLDREGLKGKYAVEVSVVPMGVPERELGAKGHGYFLDSLTFVVRTSTELPDGRIEVQSAFISGVDASESDTFADRMGKRHDFKVLAKVFKKLGLPVPEATAQSYLDSIFEISSEQMPNGVADFMRWCDEAKDELAGNQVTRIPAEYVARIEDSQRREANLTTVRDKVVEDLISDVDELRTPAEAAQHLWDLVKKHVIMESFTNKEIKPEVFGKNAAPIVKKVQAYMQSGLPPHQIQHLIEQVYKDAVISGCGGGSGSSSVQSSVSFEVEFKGTLEKTLEKLADLLANFDDMLEISSASTDKYGSRKFKCPHKGCGHVNERPKDKLIECCQSCQRNVRCD